ncbi:hypothetical protein F3N42_15010 [Marinihelvus fidelis]|uniref:Uncharacterized protein n=1 Tax=Marinihelvus fidelis TaxID=2613842 RepID=A0A5N0T489_9GAMM|nr:hypothetical protein [Marinihelvus fidelis]KAA9129672.1 hypothetical protein F3N42_15010 [Marinihelvus fidelis]
MEADREKLRESWANCSLQELEATYEAMDVDRHPANARELKQQIDQRRKATAEPGGSVPAPGEDNASERLFGQFLFVSIIGLGVTILIFRSGIFFEPEANGIALENTSLVVVAYFFATLLAIWLYGVRVGKPAAYVLATVTWVWFGFCMYQQTAVYVPFVGLLFFHFTVGRVLMTGRWLVERRKDG